MPGQRLRTSTSVQLYAQQQIASQMRELLADGTPLYPTPIEAVERVLRRLEDAWQQALLADDNLRSARMVQVIEAFAKYTGVEIAVELLKQSAQISTAPWQQQLIESGWTPPNETQVIPGLPAPSTGVVEVLPGPVKSKRIIKKGSKKPRNEPKESKPQPKAGADTGVKVIIVDE